MASWNRRLEKITHMRIAFSFKGRDVRFYKEIEKSDYRKNCWPAYTFIAQSLGRTKYLFCRETSQSRCWEFSCISVASARFAVRI